MTLEEARAVVLAAADPDEQIDTERLLAALAVIEAERIRADDHWLSMSR